MEIPIPAHFYLISEAAYYTVSSRKHNDVAIPNTSGEAADVLFGLGWGYAGWNMYSGVGFGLLEESHTSFDVERGAGDVQYRLGLSYKLKPSKPMR